MSEAARVDKGLWEGLSLYWPLLPHLSEDLHLTSKSPAIVDALCLCNVPYDKVEIPS